MSVNSETASTQGQTTVLEKESVYASLFEKINLTPASSLGDINAFLDDAALSDAPAGERLTAAMQVFMDCIRKSGQQVVQLKPDWAISYGDELLKQALMLWPEQAKPLVQQWQRQIAIAALPEDSLNGWHQGMMELELLAKRLNALDEQRGKYMTVSELKSTVFAMSQSFNSAVPVEEQLRQLSALPQEQSWPAALQSQTEQHLQQLITRYAALKQKTVE